VIDMENRGEKGNMEKIGEGMGGLAGKAADAAAEMAGAAANVAGQAASAAADVAGSLVNQVGQRLGGWWSDQGGQQRSSFGEDRERACREHFQSSSAGASTGVNRSYDEVRPLYELGHTASRNPEYRSQGFQRAENDLRSAWDDDQSKQYGDWSDVRGFVGAGFELGSEGASGGVSGNVKTSDDRAGSQGSRGSQGFQGSQGSGGMSASGGTGGFGGSGARSRGGPFGASAAAKGGLDAGSGSGGVGFRGHTGGARRDDESTTFGNSGG
jgi:hypothetical protein